MLTYDQRFARYLAQTGRTELTARQWRRIEHKANRQSPDAADARQARSEQRAQAREERKRHLAGLVASR